MTLERTPMTTRLSPQIVERSNQAAHSANGRGVDFMRPSRRTGQRSRRRTADSLSANYDRRTFVDLLRWRATFLKNQVAYSFLVDGESQEATITYSQLDRQARAIAAELQSLDLAGERAVLLYQPGLDFIAAFFGCLYAGVIAVPAYPPRRNRNLERVQAILDDAGARVALTTTEVLGRTPMHQAPELDALTWMTTDTVEPGNEIGWSVPRLSSDGVALLQYTSGSTATPRGVMVTHANLVHNCQRICDAIGADRSSKGLFWLPNYHDMGLISGILCPLYQGAPSVLLSPMAFLQRPIRWLEAISRHRATVSGGPNFAYELCIQKSTPEERRSLDLSSWAVALNGAEPVRAETLKRFTELFGPCGFREQAFHPCYGLAEATLMVSGGRRVARSLTRQFDAQALSRGAVEPISDNHPAARPLVACGEVVKGEVAIVDPDTLTPCTRGRVGEIWVSNRSVAHGYWRREAETEETFRARAIGAAQRNYLRTGDLGFLQRDELFVVGRIKDLIIVRGENHYPQDLERTAEASHPSIRASCSAAFTIDDAQQSRLVVAAEVERHLQSTADEIVAAVRTELSRQHGLRVDSVVLVRQGAIPRTSSGKIQRRACRDLLLEGELAIVARSESSAGPTGSVATDVWNAVQAVAKERASNLSLDSNLDELGLDSLERVELLAALESKLGGRFPVQVLPQLTTCRDLVEAATRYLGAAAPTPEVHREIAQEDYQFECSPEFVRLKQTFASLEQAGIANPYFTAHERVTNDTTVIDGRELINFSSYNYLGMSGDPAVSQAAKAAIDQFGTSVSASRLVSGEKTIHRELEAEIAALVGAEDAIIYVGGHATNETTLGHLFNAQDLILHDALAHNSIVQGCLLSGASRRSFPHNDWRAADELLAELRPKHRRVLIAIEGAYSMDGDIPDLRRFVDLKRRHKTFLMVDEAHSMGVLGETGRGIGEYWQIDPRDVDLWMGTLSKAFGSCGGYIAGNKSLVEYLKYTAPGFVYSVGLSPPNTAAALAAIRLLRQQPDRVGRLQARARLFLSLAKGRGLNTGRSHETPVIPIILGDSLKCLRLSHALRQRGINVQPIVHPAVEENRARLRFFITSNHTEDQIRYAITCLAAALARIEADEQAPLSDCRSARVA